MGLPEIENLVKLYRSSIHPALKKVRINGEKPNVLTVQCIWLLKNIERKITQTLLHSIVVNPNLDFITSGMMLDVTTELLSCYTTYADRRAILRQITYDDIKSQYIEIWSGLHCLETFNLAVWDVHGNVYTDDEFATFRWSPDNNRVLYIAEKKLPKSEPFYKQGSADRKDEKKEDDEISIGNEYIYKPHWGEQMVGKHRPVIAIVDLLFHEIKVLPGVPDDLSPGQLIWTPDQDIVGVAYKHEPRRLGLTACTNRISWIFLLKDEEFRKLSNDGCAVRDPRISPDGNYLIWLERDAGGPHHNAHRLMILNLKLDGQEPEILVDIVQTSREINNGKLFYGIYDSLPKRCWSADSQYIFFSTNKKSEIVSYVINLKTKTITEIENSGSALYIMDIKDDVIAFAKTSLEFPTVLLLGNFNSEVADTGIINKIQFTRDILVNGFDKLAYEANEYSYDNNDEIKQFNFIYFGPKMAADRSVPLIVIPHGGPHHSYINVFTLEYSFFALSGFAILLINYRGSTGMGSATVEYLQGKVGDVDVKDCVTATIEALKKYTWLDNKNVVLRGGSHGGFLVAHLSAQFPDLYKAVVAKNPVIDIAVMFSTSDIPDCRNAVTKEEQIKYLHNVCAASVGCPYEEYKGSDNIELFVKMMKCSPIMHVNNVKAPTLISIGSNDLRVPPDQGKLWYNRLKANNVTTKLLVYEDNHRLSKGPVEIDNIINECLWFLKYTSTYKMGEENKPQEE